MRVELWMKMGNFLYCALIVVIYSCYVQDVNSFISFCRIGSSISQVQRIPSGLQISYSCQEKRNLSASTLEDEECSSRPESKLVNIEAIASAGLTDEEVPLILSAVKLATDEYGIQFLTSDFRHESNPAIPSSVPGATGRCILLSLNNVADDWTNDDERLVPFKASISERIDNLIMQDQIQQPILVNIKPSCTMRGEDIPSLLCPLVETEVEIHDLRLIMEGAVDKDKGKGQEIAVRKPDIHVEIDGAIVPDAYTGEGVWDTSSIFVFDDFIDAGLRERLLDVVNNRHEGYNFDDKLYGPDPRRWERGGLDDTPGDEAHGGAVCWGLREEAIEQLCFGFHPAIEEVERKLCTLFSEFDIARLPESVLGPYITPLTANAPTFGDSFSYHIDADPNAAPPSPWTDIFGRYYNRVRGKPRFVSCLIYLNDEWNDEFGAPTQFYDPPTEETFQVYPKPGRCVIMDQDVTHTVVAPNERAGKQPRYSIVWKLILHPRNEKQSMGIVVSESNITRIGSATSTSSK